MTAAGGLGFIETQMNRYPYRMWHTDTCPNGKRAVWGYDRSLEDLAQSYAALSRHDFHSTCLPPQSEGRRAIVQMAFGVNKARAADRARRSLLTDLAIARVAVEKLTAEAGALTVEDADLLDVYVSQITSGAYTPRDTRDLRTVAVKPREY